MLIFKIVGENYVADDLVSGARPMDGKNVRTTSTSNVWCVAIGKFPVTKYFFHLPDYA